MVREGRVIVSNASRPAFGSGYMVTAYEVGARVAAASSGLTATVDAGHGFAAGDKLVVASSSSVDTNRWREVDTVTSTTITFTAVLSVSIGEYLVNLGPDTGSVGPNYDGSGAVIYTDMDMATVAADSTVTADSTGRYRYFHRGIRAWELVRSSSGTPVALYVDAVEPEDEDRVSYLVRYPHLFATGGTGTSADPWTGWETAFDSIPTYGTTIIFAEGYYTKNGTIDLPVNLTGWLKIKGYGGAIIKITSTTPGLFGVASHDNYDTLKYIHIEGLRIDANSVAGSTSVSSPVFIGAYTTKRNRLNYANIVIRDIVITNVSDTGKNQGIVLQTQHAASGETATSCVDVLIENVHQTGGNSGIVLTAGADDSSVAVTHTFERITVRGCYHKSGTTPTALVAAAGCQIGEKAIVKDTLVEGCYWQNNGDVGVEIDNPYGVVVRDSTAVDCYGVAFYSRNFNTLVEPSKNSILFEGCRTRVSAGVTSDLNAFFGFQAFGATAGLAMGSAVFKDCLYENLDDVVHRPINQDGYTKRLVYDGLVVNSPNLVGADATYYNMVKWFNYYNGSTNIVRNSRIDWAMNAASVNPLLVSWQFEIEAGRLEFENGVIRGAFTNPGASHYYAAIDAAQSASFAQNITGFVRGLRVESVTNGLGSSSTVGVGFRQYLGTSSNIIVEQCDLAGMPSGCSYFSVGAVADRPYVTFRSNLTSVGGYRPGLAIASPRNVGTWSINSATAGTDTACTNGTAYVGSIYVPEAMTVTGVQYLVGSVGGTDSVVASIHDSSGTLLANSALSGTTVGTAAQLQQVALTATYVLVPGWYFVALTFNGTTAKFRSIPAYCNAGSGVLGNGVTQTFGTAANFTAPTTFTADKVPVASLY